MGHVEAIRCQIMTSAFSVARNSDHHRLRIFFFSPYSSDKNSKNSIMAIRNDNTWIMTRVGIGV